jgi:riboflavin kinase/FMN adenylyltransferase
MGNVTLLTELAEPYECKIQVFPDYAIAQDRVSSTRIRQALQAGELQQVEKLLGRPYSMCGRVMRGKGLGKQWGIPTANLNLNRLNLPLKGVFAVDVQRMNGERRSGVANIGTRPTVDGSKNILEIHLFEFEDSLYGEMLQVFFNYKLRDEVKFSSVDALIQQIHLDISMAKEVST